MTTERAIELLQARYPNARREETHLSHLFITPSETFKLKKAVRLPFADFSTPEKRRDACLTELAVNRRFARGLYIDVLPIDDDGFSIDWVVHMHSFRSADRLDRMLSEKRVPPNMLTRLADDLYSAHERVPPLADIDWASAFTRTQQQVASGLKACADTGDATRWLDAAEQRSEEIADMLSSRNRFGAVRAGHGDLHAKNVCFWSGRLVPFDALEFDPDLARTDRLYDLAFLTMDCRKRGWADAASTVLNRYLGLTGDYAAGRLVPLYESVRAAIRSLAESLSGQGERAEEYLSFAIRRLARQRMPLQLLIGGRSGTGKSALAARLAEEHGAILIRSDVIRKRNAGLMPEERLPAEAYTPMASKAVYGALEQGFDALSGHCPVIADATFGRSHALFAPQATKVWLTAPARILESRIERRSNDASDAGPGVLEHQAAAPPSDEWIVVDASGPLESTLAAVRTVIAQAA